MTSQPNMPVPETPVPPPAEPSVAPVVPTRKRRRWPLLLGLVFVALIILGGAGFVTASALEEHDSFCVACHTVPEVTYFNHAYVSLDNPTDAVPDLATAHYLLAQQKGSPTFECIDCHRGDSSLGQRISTLALGGRDALIFVTGHENPTISKTNIAEAWLPNNACIACHTETLLRLDGINNHFHNYLHQATDALQRGGTLTVAADVQNNKQQLIANGIKPIDVQIACTDCHQPHVTVANGMKNNFINTDITYATCVSCHVVAKKGPQDVKDLKNN